jgi:hypothetical protein
MKPQCQRAQQEHGAKARTADHDRWKDPAIRGEDGAHFRLCGNWLSHGAMPWTVIHLDESTRQSTLPPFVYSHMFQIGPDAPTGKHHRRRVDHVLMRIAAAQGD